MPPYAAHVEWISALLQRDTRSTIAQMEAAFEPANEPHPLDDADLRAGQQERLMAFAEELVVDQERVEAHLERLLARAASWPE